MAPLERKTLVTVMAFDFASRVKRLRKELASANCDAVFVGGGSCANVYYYTGDRTQSFALITRDSINRFTDYNGMALGESRPLKNVRKQLTELFKQEKIKRLAIDERTASAFFAWWLAKQKIKAKPFNEKLFGLRAVKDAGEQAAIARAQSVSRACVAKALENPWGKTVNELAGIMEFTARKLARDLRAFEPIVAVSPLNAVPHAPYSSDKAVKSKTLLLDVGARVGCYCGDYSKTVYEGSDKRIKDAMLAVKEAQKAAMRKAKPGVKGKLVSDAAVEVIKEYGFANYSFRKTGYSIGHHVGLDVHDHCLSVDKITLKKGNVITIEPGIYVPKEFGIRFEDLVFV